MYGLGLNLTVRVQTDDHGPMSYERPHHVKYYLFQILHMPFSQSSLLCILNNYQFNFLTVHVMNGFFNRENLFLHQRSWLQQNI